MEIYGYSERGAMNALFYGIAFNPDKTNGENDLRDFIKLANIIGDFRDFELYMEFSLSDFGDPDLLITATNSNNERVAFFVEAKVSSQKKYNYAKEMSAHKKQMLEGDYKKINSSNLFFQLKEKYMLFSNKEKDLSTNGINALHRNRKTGKNPVVHKLIQKIKECNIAYYIAIIPRQDDSNTMSKQLSDNKENINMTINVVYWEELAEKYQAYLKGTLDFNFDTNSNMSQITNN